MCGHEANAMSAAILLAIFQRRHVGQSLEEPGERLVVAEASLQRDYFHFPLRLSQQALGPLNPHAEYLVARGKVQCL